MVEADRVQRELGQRRIDLRGDRDPERPEILLNVQRAEAAGEEVERQMGR